MKPEDRYTSGLAAGAGLAAGGSLAALAGAARAREGRAAAVANRGGRGDVVRGNRMIRAGQGQMSEAKAGLAQFKRVTAANGRTMYFQDGKIAPTKQFKDLGDAGRRSMEDGRKTAVGGQQKRSRARAGVAAMRRGRLVARAGVAGAALGAGVAGASIVAGERARARFVRRQDSRFMAAQNKAKATADQESLRRARINGLI